MKEPKLTPWFGPYTKPARVGVYPTRLSLDGLHLWDGYAYWMGDRWASAQATANGAAYYRYTVSTVQARYWRGLTTKDGA